MKKRGHSDTKTRAKSSSAVTSIPPRLTLFGQPQLLEGEDAAAYDQLLARIRAVVKPIDIIDEMFIADVMSLEWEVLRWRRLERSLLQARALKRLEDFLAKQLDCDLYREHFEADLAEVLQEKFSKDRSEDAWKLARESARGIRTSITRSINCSPTASRRASRASCALHGPARQENLCKSMFGVNRTPSR
jgi:hypothetical protein